MQCKTDVEDDEELNQDRSPNWRYRYFESRMLNMKKHEEIWGGRAKHMIHADVCKLHTA